MESLPHEFWERLDFDPSCHADKLDYDFETLLDPVSWDSSFAMEACSHTLRYKLFGLSPVRAFPEDDLTDAETLFQGLEGVTADVPVDDPVSAPHVPKQEVNSLGVPGCDLFSDLSISGMDTLKSDCMWTSTLSNVPESPTCFPSLAFGECPDVKGMSGGLLCSFFEMESAAACAPCKPKPEAGGSLLQSINCDLFPDPEASATLASQQMLIDHSYFSLRPPTSRPGRCPLTLPENNKDESFALIPGNIDKRKLVKAVQSLMKKNSNSGLSERVLSNEGIKFKFRMKYNTNSFLAARPKSHCFGKQRASSCIPDPQWSSSKFRKSHLAHSCPLPSPKSGKEGQCTLPNQNKKVRETRDLHNLMERQRRVDLRKNFEKLKSVVPELAIMEKASKLSILNRAALYCSQLTRADAVLKKEADCEDAKRQQLRKKLQDLK